MSLRLQYIKHIGTRYGCGFAETDMKRKTLIIVAVVVVVIIAAVLVYQHTGSSVSAQPIPVN
jgi:hypothetical protein